MNKKLLIFGTGNYFKNRRDKFNNTEIIAFIDNNKDIVGDKFDNKDIISPAELSSYNFDYIILMSNFRNEMKKQLLNNYNIEEGKILFYEQYKRMFGIRNYKYYQGKSENETYKEKFLIVTTILEYVGGSIAPYYTAMALENLGYKAVLAANSGNEKFISELQEEGIDIIIDDKIDCGSWEELSWMHSYKYAIVNTIDMAYCANMLNRHLSVLWWIHDSDILFKRQDPKVLQKIESSDLKVYAVSEVAKKTSLKYMNINSLKVLPFGIPDWNKEKEIKVVGKKIIFAIIGGIQPIKGQDILLEAISKLSDNETKNMEIWIAGKFSGTVEYNSMIEKWIEKIPQVKWIGELTRKEMRQLYKKIDIVVGPSRQDALPMVIVEGMMYGKVCITSEVTGMASYIEDGVNGLICKTENVKSVYENIIWLSENKNKINSIGVKARQTYERHFSLEVFQKKLIRELGLEK